MLEQEETKPELEVIEVEEEPEDVEETPLVEGAEEVRGEAQRTASTMVIEDYTGVGSQLNHGHDRDKHDVRDAFGVNEELVTRFFHYDPTDHAALHEMLARKEEFIASDVPVFTDAPDNSKSKWNAIKARAGGAPVPADTHRKLDKIQNKEL